MLYKKFLVKPNWVRVRQIIGGNIAPPPLHGPDVKLKAWT